MVLVCCKCRRAPSGRKRTSIRLRHTRLDLACPIKRFDFLRKEKNATKQAAQKAKSKGRVRSKHRKVCFRRCRVIGNLGLAT